MIHFEDVWRSIMNNQGSEFTQKMGKRFTYTMKGTALVPSTTNFNIPKSQMEKAWNRMPINGPGEINDLIAPSYLYAILNDKRILLG